MNNNLTKNVSNEAENPAFLVGTSSSNCLPFFHRIVEINKNNGWVNPIFQPNNTEKFKDEFFCVKVDDFLEIEDNYEINIFRVSKRWGEIIIYCRVVQYN
jgi:hypothetical protein